MTDASAAYTKRSWEMSKAAHEEKAALLKKNGMTVTEAPAAVVDAMKKVGKQMTQEWKATANADAIAVVNLYEASQAKTN